MELTPQERRDDIHEALFQAMSIEEEKFLLGEAIKQAEERGRVEMRERCAKIAAGFIRLDVQSTDVYGEGFRQAASNILKEIRARSQEKT